MTIERHWLEFPSGIPMGLWGKDHNSTLLYAETCAVDNRGKLSSKRMRVAAHEYPTRLLDGSVVYGHTDYMCLLDAKAAGLVSQVPEEGDEETPVIFTQEGWNHLAWMRRRRAEKERSNGS